MLQLNKKHVSFMSLMRLCFIPRGECPRFVIFVISNLPQIWSELSVLKVLATRILVLVTVMIDYLVVLVWFWLFDKQSLMCIVYTYMHDILRDGWLC